MLPRELFLQIACAWPVAWLVGTPPNTPRHQSCCERQTSATNRSVCAKLPPYCLRPRFSRPSLARQCQCESCILELAEPGPSTCCHARCSCQSVAPVPWPDWSACRRARPVNHSYVERPPEFSAQDCRPLARAPALPVHRRHTKNFWLRAMLPGACRARAMVTSDGKSFQAENPILRLCEASGRPTALNARPQSRVFERIPSIQSQSCGKAGPGNSSSHAESADSKTTPLLSACSSLQWRKMA